MGREVVQPQQQTVPYTVEQLVAVNPYNPDILPDLENYVNEQVLLHHHLFFFFFFFWGVKNNYKSVNSVGFENLIMKDADFLFYNNCRCLHKHTVLMQIYAFFAFIR